MKKMLSRATSGILAMTMVMSLCACGGQSAATSETKAPETQAASASKTEAAADNAAGNAAGEAASGTEAAQPAGEPVYINENASELTGEVRFYTAFAEEVGTGALIADFNQYYPNVKVIPTVYKNNSDGNVAIDTAMIGGEVDVVLSFGVANTAARWENNLFLDITDRLAADNLDLVAEWGTDAYTLKDRVYSFPSGAMSYYVAINMDKWNEAGLGDLPAEWTWDEYLDACRAMTKDGVYGGLDYSDKDSWVNRVRQVKGLNAYYGEDGMTDFDSELWAKALQIEVDAEKEGIWYSKPDLSANNLRNHQLFLGGQVATSVDCILTRYITSIDHDFMIGYAPYPVMEKGQENYLSGPISYSHIGIAANCQDEEAAYAFAKFAATLGNKYMYASGHAGTWTGNNGDEILGVVFGTLEEAEKWVDPDGFNEYVVAAGKPAYAENCIVAYTDIFDILTEYTDYVLVGEMTVEEMMADLKKYGDEAIEDAK